MDNVANLMVVNPPVPPPLRGLGFLVIRMIMGQGQERMDEEGCGPVYAALRWPVAGVGDFQ